MVYDINDHQTFDNLDKRLHNILVNKFDAKKTVIIVGNKTDLGKRKTNTEEIRGFLRRQPYSTEYLETSAVTGQGIEELFSKAVNKGITRSILSWIRARGFLWVCSALSTRIP